MKDKIDICRDIERLFPCTAMPYESDELYRIVSELVDTANAPRFAADKGPFESELVAIQTELLRAMAKFPTWPTDPIHAVAVLGEEFGELTQAVLQCTYEPAKSSPEEVRKEAIQTAAMALRFLVSLALYEYRPGAQHQQDGLSVDSNGGHG